jgi:predicted TIM-barrel fold metal-dependent hydrolase
VCQVEQVVALPDGLVVVDPHIHQWNPYTTPREASLPAKIVRRVPLAERLVPVLAPRPAREFVGDPQHVLRPYLPENYRSDAAPVPVGSIVHIEAGWHGREPMGGVGETAWVAALPFGVDGSPRLGAIVCHADPTKPGVGAELDAHLRASDLVRGVRCMAARHDDAGVRSWTSRPHLLTDADFLRGFAAIAERDLSFEVWVYSRELPDVVTLAREYPHARLILDHYGTPVGAFGPRGQRTGATARERRNLLERWADDLAAVAACSNVIAKHSGLGMPVLGWPSAVSPAEFRDTVAPLVTRTHELFGPERTMWASNFPMDKPIVTLAATVDALLEILGPDVDARRLFRSNAEEVYRLTNA